MIEPDAKALSIFKDGKPIIDKHSNIEALKAEVRFTSLPLPSNKEIYEVITILAIVRREENKPKGVNYEQLVTEYLTDELLLKEPLPCEFDALIGDEKESEAIRLLGMSRRAFYYKLRKYNAEGLG
ncbi:MAG: helix-turn-helix domain-containing protein [Thermodesulfobacteriota bacterium]|nr:helix-turn-helix domain-containing protein [Thermodesulfobacteriota bacterium]